MIRSFRDKRTRLFAEAGEHIPHFHAFRRSGRKAPSHFGGGNILAGSCRPFQQPLEALGGDRKGQHSVRINKQWRICFEWPRGADGPKSVEIVDYH